MLIKAKPKSKHRLLKLIMTTLGVAGIVAAIMKTKGNSKKDFIDQPATKAKAKKKSPSKKAKKRPGKAA
jgi:hypothetical protein